MARSLLLDKITKDFDPKKDLPLGPWCFQDVEDLYPSWDLLDFINPFATAAEMEEASKYALALYESLVPDLTQRFNERHNVNLSEFSWRHLLIGWYLLLIQVSYVRFAHIKAFIARHKEENFNVTLAPKNIKWDLDISHSLSQYTSRSDFDYWLSSLIIRQLAPPSWNLIEDKNFQVHQDEKTNHPNVETVSLTLREKVRDSVVSWIKNGRFGFVYGTIWQSQLFFSLFLIALPAKRKGALAKNYVPMANSFDPEKYFSEDYRKILDVLAQQTLPKCYEDHDVFQIYLKQAQSFKYQENKLRVITPDVFNEEEKFKTVMAYEAREKILATQHGSWYGTVSCSTVSHMAEYAHYGFLSWGWTKHEYKGHYIALPSPFLNRAIQQRKKSLEQTRTQDLLFVENIVNLRSARLSGQPAPADIVKRRYDKKTFIEKLSTHIYPEVIYRPHIHHSAGIDETSFLKRHFKDMRVLTDASMDETLNQCKLYVSNHYGTTLHVSLAADIPTVCYWDNDYPPMTESARPYFERLKENKILFDNPQDAAAHINDVWDNLEEWWQNPELQKAKKDWCYHYARTSPLWVFDWIKMFIRL